MELDCSDLESTCRSLAPAISRTPERLWAELKSYTQNEFEDAITKTKIEPSNVLWRTIVGDSNPWIPDSVVWFHGTRVDPNCRFQSGILPLHLCLNRLESWVEEFATNAGITKQSPHHQPEPSVFNNSAYLYHMKTSDSRHWGPYAFLTRDALVDPEGTGHYLSTPEIVEDIIRSQYSSDAETLLELFRTRTHPCIVHFRDVKPRDDVAETALHYLHSGVHGCRPRGSIHTCFDGGGEIVDVGLIIRIEFLDQDFTQSC